MNHVHDLLNSALSLQNIAEMIEENARLSEAQRSVVIEELEAIIRQLQHLHSTLNENG